MPDPDDVMRQLGQEVQRVLGPHLITVDDNVIRLTDMAAGTADRLICQLLDEARDRGEITAYEYESVLDPVTKTLHCKVAMMLPSPDAEFIIRLAGPDD